MLLILNFITVDHECFVANVLCHNICLYSQMNNLYSRLVLTTKIIKFLDLWYCTC